MYRFRVLIIISIVWLFAILNWGRLVDDTALQDLTIQPFVSILIFVMIILHIAILSSSTWSYTLGNIVILLAFGIGKIVTFRGTFAFHTFVPSLVLEMFVLLTSYWLVRELAAWFQTYSSSLRQSIFNPINTLVRNTYADETVIEQKIALARRFDRELTLLYIQLDEQPTHENRVIWDNLKEIKLATLQLRLAELLGFLAGDTSVKAWHEGNLVICLQVERKEVNMIITELQDVISDVLKMHIEVGFATFPKDGLMFDDLVEKAINQIFDPMEALKGLPQTRPLQQLDLDTRPPKHSPNRP